MIGRKLRKNSLKHSWMFTNKRTERRAGILGKIGFRIGLAEHAVCKLKLQDKTLAFSQRFTFVPTPRIYRDNRTSFATDFDEVFWGIMSADLFIRNPPVMQNRCGFAFTGTAHIAMGPGPGGNVREIKEKLNELDAIHVKMIQLSGLGSCFSMEGTTPPHSHNVEDRSALKKTLSNAVQPGIHKKLLDTGISEYVVLSDVILGRFDRVL